MTTDEDRDLMQRVVEGDAASFELLVTRYRPALVRVAAQTLGDLATAEDVAQETLLAVYAARHTYNPSFSFRTWLWTILLNLCRRTAARRARRPGTVSTTLPGERFAFERERSAGETALAALLNRETSDRLQRFLSELPASQGDAIRLRFFAGMTYEEIARSAGISLGGAKLRVRSGLAKLAARLRAESETSDEL